jgi:CRP-like cAMP-binding protein
VLQDEVQCLKRVKDLGSHPNIVDLKGIVSIEGMPQEMGLVFELLDGGELYEHLTRNGAYSEHRAAILVGQVADALAFLHQANLVHGDLKPENLVLAKDGSSVKLCDFGSCVGLDPKDGMFTLQAHRPVGTVAYAAPELLTPATKTSRASGKVDVWSLGVVLYVILSGSHPFDPDNEISTDEELLPQIVKCEYDFDSPVWSKISEDAKSLIRAMLDKDPAKRISAREILDHPWVKSGGNREALVGSDVRLQGFMRTQRVLQDRLFRMMVDGSLRNDSEALEQFWKTVDSQGKGYVTAEDLGEPREAEPAAAGGAEDKVFYKSLNGLVGLGERHSLPAQTKVFEAGDPADAFYFVDKGKVEVLLAGRVVTVLGPGEFFGETALIRNRTRNAAVRTATPCELVKFSREDFERLSRRDPSVNRALNERVDQRSVEHVKAVYSFLFTDAETLHLGQGSVLLKKGEPSPEMYYIVEGVVDVVNSSGTVVAQRREGETVGELGLVTGEPRSMTILCSNPLGCAFKRLTRADLDRLVMFSPHADSELRKAIVGRSGEGPRRANTRIPEGTAVNE